MEPEIIRHFVIFLSPGTFIAEQSQYKMDSWDIDKAVKISYNVKERHGAVPYAFYFTTRGRAAEDLDSKEIKRSPMHYLGGTIYTLEEVKAKNDPKDKILIRNMEGNNMKRIIINTNSWKSTTEFHDDDVLLDYNIKEKGDVGNGG